MAKYRIFMFSLDEPPIWRPFDSHASAEHFNGTSYLLEHIIKDNSAACCEPRASKLIFEWSAGGHKFCTMRPYVWQTWNGPYTQHWPQILIAIMFRTFVSPYSRLKVCRDASFDWLYEPPICRWKVLESATFRCIKDPYPMQQWANHSSGVFRGLV